MTPERMNEMQAKFLAMSRAIDEWCIYKARGRSKNDMAAMLVMYDARKVAEGLLDELMKEATEGLMLRTAYLQAVNGTLPQLH